MIRYDSDQELLEKYEGILALDTSVILTRKAAADGALTLETNPASRLLIFNSMLLNQRIDQIH